MATKKPSTPKVQKQLPAFKPSPDDTHMLAAVAAWANQLPTHLDGTHNDDLSLSKNQVDIASACQHLLGGHLIQEAWVALAHDLLDRVKHTNAILSHRGAHAHRFVGRPKV